MPRTLKQILYGAFYLAIFAGAIYGIYLFIILRQPASCFDNRRNQGEEAVDCGGPCAPCALKSVRAIATTTPQILEASGNVISAIIELRNSNTGFGAESFSYTLNFYNSAGGKIQSVKGSSFIYPAEIKTLVEPVINVVFSQIARSEIVIENIVWREAVEFTKPFTEIRDLKTQKTKDGAAVSGLFFNGNPYELSRVGVSAIVFNNLGFRLGVSKTTLQDIKPSEQRFFSISIPVGAVQNLDQRLTKVFVEPRR